MGIADYSILLAGSEIDTITQCRRPLTYLSPQITYAGGVIPDTLNWTAVAGTFVAAGTEKYLVLGNFKTDAATQTMVINAGSLPQSYSDPDIDDVSLVDIDLPAFAGKDTNIVWGDSIFLGRTPDVGLDYACHWYRLPNDSVPLDTAAGIWVKSTVKTTYVVRQQLWCSGVKWDTVTVHFNTVGVEEEREVGNVRLFPNPANKQLKISWMGTREKNEPLQLYNSLGQMLNAQLTVIGSNELTLDTSELSAGVYWIRLGESTTKRFVVQH